MSAAFEAMAGYQGDPGAEGRASVKDARQVLALAGSFAFIDSPQYPGARIPKRALLEVLSSSPEESDSGCQILADKDADAVYVVLEIIGGY